VERSAVSHIWRKERARYGAPRFCRTIFERAKRSGERSAVRQKQIPFRNDRKKAKGDAFAPVEMTNFIPRIIVQGSKPVFSPKGGF
jgi:hypothetical protein